MSADSETRAFYDAEASAYADRFAKQRPLKALAAFAERLPKGALVLDYGCGAGQDAAALRDLGLQVVCLDASEGLAAVARDRFGLDVRLGDFESLDDVEAFDAIWANASLHHATNDRLPGIFALMLRALKPGGVLEASLKVGEDRRDALGRFYCAMSEERLRELASGFVIEAIETRRGGGFDDVAVDWLRLRARRP